MISPNLRFVCIVTHHKTGTVWMRRVFTRIAAALGIPFGAVLSPAFVRGLPEAGRAIVFRATGTLPDRLSGRKDLAVLHLIRDPRDILLSGCAYHLATTEPAEQFLYQPRADLGGLTYQQHLQRLPTDIDRLMFEMAGKHADTLAEMRNWDYSRAGNVELRYEDLMADTDCALFRTALRQLGFSADEAKMGAKIFGAHSLFGGLSQPEMRTGRLATHVKSGGRLARWRAELPHAVAAAYAQRHGADLISLGYEADLSWADRLFSIKNEVRTA